MRVMSQNGHMRNGGLGEALTLLRVEISNNRGLLTRTASLVELQEERARIIEARIRALDMAADTHRSRDKPEPLYATVLAVARRYCIATGRPLNRHDILYWMEVEGHILNVSNPEKFVSKNIWMSKRFVSFEQGYWPNDLPAPMGVTPNRRKRTR